MRSSHLGTRIHPWVPRVDLQARSPLLNSHARSCESVLAWSCAIRTERKRIMNSRARNVGKCGSFDCKVDRSHPQWVRNTCRSSTHNRSAQAMEVQYNARRLALKLMEMRRHLSVRSRRDVLRNLANIAMVPASMHRKVYSLNSAMSVWNRHEMLKKDRKSRVARQAHARTFTSLRHPQ